MAIIGLLQPLKVEPPAIHGPLVVSRSKRRKSSIPPTTAAEHANHELADRADAEQPLAIPAGGPAEESVTPAQRRTLFAWAGRRGLNIDDLRAATPEGSISRLSRSSAAGLIELLSSGAAVADPIEPQGTVTARQLSLLIHLSHRVRFSSAGLETWLRRHFGLRSIQSLADKSEASRIIAALLKILQARELRS